MSDNNKYQAVCEQFADNIEQAQPRVFASGGGIEFNVPNTPWSVGIYATEELMEEGESYDRLNMPLSMLFRSRQDLVVPVFEARSLNEVIDTCSNLAEWLRLYGFDVGLRGTTPWAKAKLAATHGISKLLKFAGA